MSVVDYETDLETYRQSFLERQQQRYQEMEARRRLARATVLEALRAVLPHYPEVRQVYLFGSVIKPGAFHHSSDIDVAVEGTNAEQYFALWHELNKSAPEWIIDLREINQPSHFAQSVRQRGEKVYEREDPPASI
jgi:predicted nucleotidyltransferase